MDKEKIIYPELSYEVMGCLFEVFKKIGSDHREKYYQKAISVEFLSKNIKFQAEVPVDISYKSQVIGKNYLDFLIDDKIVLEIKVGNYFKKEGFDQLLSYLKISHLKLGIIATFTKNGVKSYRVLNEF